MKKSVFRTFIKSILTLLLVIVASVSIPILMVDLFISLYATLTIGIFLSLLIKAIMTMAVVGVIGVIAIVIISVNKKR